MENRAHALIAGVFILLLGIILALAAYWISQRGPQRVPYDILTPYAVTGLSVQAPVKYRGVQIGIVDEIGFASRRPGLIRIRIAVDPDAPITTRTFAQLNFQGVTGLSYVELAESGPGGQLLATKGDSPAEIPMRQSFLAEFGSLGQTLLVRLNQLVDKMNQLGGPENQAHINNILANVETITQDVSDMQAALNPSLQELPQLIDSSERTVSETRQLVQDMRALTRSAQAQVEQIGETSQSFSSLGQTGQQIGQHISNTTLPELHTLMNSLTRTSESLDRFVNDLQQRPQSLIFGRRPAAPGPGENGFVPPAPKEATP